MLVALLITDVAFGVVSRVVPQLNVFAVGFPTKVAVVLLVVGASLPFTANWISNSCPSASATPSARCTSREPWPTSDRTEKATPKHRKRAREKGQVARSTDLGGSIVRRRRAVCAQPDGLADRQRRRRHVPRDPRRDRASRQAHDRCRAERPDALDALHRRARRRARSPVRACSPACSAASRRSASNPTAHSLKPDFRRINPVSGLRNLLGVNAGRSRR